MIIIERNLSILGVKYKEGYEWPNMDPSTKITALRIVLQYQFQLLDTNSPHN